jgi:large subunit ribosomal protein L33
MAKKGARIVIHFACTECARKPRNYTSEKNKKNDTGRMELMKYCNHCRKHTMHRETK